MYRVANERIEIVAVAHGPTAARVLAVAGIGAKRTEDGSKLQVGVETASGSQVLLLAFRLTQLSPTDSGRHGKVEKITVEGG